jgi:hypothetical protein
MSYIQPNFNLNLQVAKNLVNDYNKSDATDGRLRSSISTIIDYKISSLSRMAGEQNQNLLNQISSVVLN